MGSHTVSAILAVSLLTLSITNTNTNTNLGSLEELPLGILLQSRCVV